MHKTFAIAFSGFVAHVHAFWRMECPGIVGEARMDPVVYPGQTSPHVHSISGSSAFSETSTTADLLAGNCTSCRVTEDHSSYWFAPLYFQDAETQEYELVPQVGGILVYYLLYGNVTAFPTNFRMVAGTSDRRNYTLGDPMTPDPDKSSWAALGQTSQSDLAQRAIGFNCLNYDKDPEPTLYRHYLPDKEFLDANCKDGLRLEILFPSCWKGGDAIDSPDHKKHVAYPDLALTGNCPPDYPFRLPTMMFEIIFNIGKFSNRTGRFIFSNNDPTGYGAHGDFIMGWDQSVLRNAIQTCTNPSGRIEDCSVFNVVDQSVATQCKLDKLPEALAKEQVYGPLTALPGYGQKTSEDNSSEPGNTAPQPSSSTSPGDVLMETKSASALPSVASVGLSMSTASDAVHAATATPTTTPAPENAFSAESVSFFRTQYVTHGNTVSKILWQQEVVVVTEYDCATGTVNAAVTATTASTPQFESRGYPY